MVISVKSFNTERRISNDNKMLNGLTLKWHVLKYEITELLILVPHFSIKLILRKARLYKSARSR